MSDEEFKPFTDMQSRWIEEQISEPYQAQIAILVARIAELEAEVKQANDNIPKIQSLAYSEGYAACRDDAFMGRLTR